MRTTEGGIEDHREALRITWESLRVYRESLWVYRSHYGNTGIQESLRQYWHHYGQYGHKAIITVNTA